MRLLTSSRRQGISPVLATVILIGVTLIAAVAIAGFVFGLFGSFADSIGVSVNPEIYAPQQNIGVLNQNATFVITVTNQRPSSINGSIIILAAGQVAEEQSFNVVAGGSAAYTMKTALYATGEWTIVVATSDTTLHPYSFFVEQNTDSAIALLASNNVVQQQTWIAVIAAGAAAVTAFGVFIGPNLAERARRREEARNSHLNSIKSNVLIPIGNAAATLLEQHFRYSDMFGLVINNENDPMPKSRLSLLLNTPLGFGVRGRLVDLSEDKFDRVLFEDLGNHYPTLKSHIDEAQKTLEGRGSHTMELRWALGKKIFTLTKPTIDSMKPIGSMSRMGVALAAGVMYLTGAPTDQWPAMHDAAVNGEVLPILDGLKSNKEVMDLASNYEIERRFVAGDLEALLKEISKIVESERSLPRNCEYLG